nr:cation transporter [uncultured Draconibacterium sp.]
MKKLILLLTVAMFIGFAETEALAQKKGNKVVCFKSDMDCAQCEQTLQEYMKFEKGVKDLKVDHASNTIFVEYKEGKNSDDKLAAAIEKKGYKAEKITKKEYEEIVNHAKEHEHSEEVHKERK